MGGKITKKRIVIPQKVGNGGGYSSLASTGKGRFADYEEGEREYKADVVVAQVHGRNREVIRYKERSALTPSKNVVKSKRHTISKSFVKLVEHAAGEKHGKYLRGVKKKSINNLLVLEKMGRQGIINQKSENGRDRYK